MVQMPAIPDPLVTELLSGSNRALGDLYRLTHEALLHFMISRLNRGGRAAEAEDLTQDVYIRLQQRIASGAHLKGDNIGGLLYTIGRNLVADHFKSARVRLTVNPGDGVIYSDDSRPEALEALASDDPRVRPDRVFEHQLLATVLRRKLVRLTPEQCRALTLRYLGAMSNKEVAQQMGIGEGAVKAMIYRGLTTIAQRSGVTRHS